MEEKMAKGKGVKTWDDPELTKKFHEILNAVAPWLDSPGLRVEFTDDPDIAVIRSDEGIYYINSGMEDEDWGAIVVSNLCWQRAFSDVVSLDKTGPMWKAWHEAQSSDRKREIFFQLTQCRQLDLLERVVATSISSALSCPDAATGERASLAQAYRL